MYDHVISCILVSGTHYTIMRDALDGRLFAVPQLGEQDAATHIGDEAEASCDIAIVSQDPRNVCRCCVPSWENQDSSGHESNDNSAGCGAISESDHTGDGDCPASCLRGEEEEESSERTCAVRKECALTVHASSCV